MESSDLLVSPQGRSKLGTGNGKIPLKGLRLKPFREVVKFPVFVCLFGLPAAGRSAFSLEFHIWDTAGKCHMRHSLGKANSSIMPRFVEGIRILSLREVSVSIAGGVEKTSCSLASSQISP